MFNDIFDEFNAHMREVFGDWSIFNDDFDELIEDFNEQIKEEHVKEDNKKSKNKNYKKNYSISYRYETGMKEPEIYVEGDATQEDIDRFMKHVEKGFGKHLLGTEHPEVKMLSGGSTQDANGFKIPTHEIHEEKEKAVVTLEMPGIGKKNIKIEQDKKNVTITAEKDELKYKKTIKLNFEPKLNEITANNGIISIEFRK